MVTKLKLMLSQFRDDHQTVSLLAILKMDEFTDRWSVVFSAPDLDNVTKRRVLFKYLVNKIKDNLTEDEVKTIARVGVFPIDNHLVKDLLKFRAGYAIEEDTRINGNVVHEGHIIESQDTAKIL